MEQSYQIETWETGSDNQLTTLGTVLAGQNLAGRAPLGQVSATGKFVLWNPAASDGSEKAVRLTSFAVDASGGDKNVGLIKSGTFNPELVAWPDGTSDVHKAIAFVGTPISLQVPVG